MNDTMTERLSKVGPLARGAHKPEEGVMCITEAVAYVAGEPWSDAPKCACPVISALVRYWNDALPDEERDVLLRPLIPRLVGTRKRGVKLRRVTMAVDWLIREHPPAWLRLAGLTTHADALASLPEITDLAQSSSLRPALNAARDAACAAWAAWDWNAGPKPGWGAAFTAAQNATCSAAFVAAFDAARSVTRVTVANAIWDTVQHAARAAAFTAAWNGAWDAFNTTRLELQQSALRLVDRMIGIDQ